MADELFERYRDALLLGHRAARRGDVETAVEDDARHVAHAAGQRHCETEAERGDAIEHRHVLASPAAEIWEALEVESPDREEDEKIGRAHV